MRVRRGDQNFFVAALAFAGSLLAAPCRAETVIGSDFAYGIELSPLQKQAVHGFALPEQVLRALTDRELGDLCVFDAEGVRRPHAIHVPREARTALVDEEVPFFPLEAAGERTTDGVEVRVERDPGGNITRAFSKSIVERDAHLTGYLVDTHALQDPLMGLTLTIRSSHDYTLELQIDAGDDLTSFRPDNTATLAHLEHEGRTLDRDYVELSGEVHAKFLRLSFPRSASSDLRIEKVQARVLRPTQASARRFVELTRRSLAPGEQVTRQDPSRAGQSFEYTVAGVFTFDRYRVALPRSTPLVEASLLSAPSASGPFRELDRGLFRESDGAASERTLAPTEHNFFELRISDKGGGVREGEPKVAVGYLPPQLLFAGNDSATYLLAYGSATARCRRFAESELSAGDPAQEVSLSDSVRPVHTKTLGGVSALDKPAPPRPWRVYVLWGVLLVAVGALAVAARKLVKNG
jgi:hypothetical protein